MRSSLKIDCLCQLILRDSLKGLFTIYFYGCRFFLYLYRLAFFANSAHKKQSKYTEKTTTKLSVFLSLPSKRASTYDAWAWPLTVQMQSTVYRTFYYCWRNVTGVFSATSLTVQHTAQTHAHSTSAHRWFWAGWSVWSNRTMCAHTNNFEMMLSITIPRCEWQTLTSTRKQLYTRYTTKRLYFIYTNTAYTEKKQIDEAKMIAYVIRIKSNQITMSEWQTNGSALFCRFAALYHLRASKKCMCSVRSVCLIFSLRNIRNEKKKWRRARREEQPRSIIWLTTIKMF